MSLISRRLWHWPSRLSRLNLQARFQQTKPKLSVSGDVIPIFGNVQLFPERVALKDNVGSYTYANIFLSAKELSKEILAKVEGKNNQRVLFLCPNDANYVITLWAIWMSGQIAVPLSPHHPKNLLLYYANDTNSSLLITTPEHSDLMQRISKTTNTQLHVLDEKLRSRTTEKTFCAPSDLESPTSLSFYSSNNALIIYTSGTTGNPKGVVLSHKNLVFQVKSLTTAWRWSEADTILHTLPLHHVHGIVNCLLCPLYVGAKTVMLPKFNENAVWSHLLAVNGNNADKRINVFMGVPTIYSKLIDEYDKVFSADPRMVDYIKNTLSQKVRLMVSGSAPLPVPVFNKWLELSGHRLLERYGMTEVGMCLSNLYETHSREPGYVGVPLPGVSARLVEKTDTLLQCADGNCEYDERFVKDGEISGELLVKSDGVFKEYFNRPEATKKEFTEDRWFKTGDMCSYNVRKNKFKILGRISADIIKSGGYKLSALQIETVLLSHPLIKDCAVVGLKDEKYGEKVAAVVVLTDSQALSLESLRKWLEDKLPKYSAPTVLEVVKEIPKNAMGKVNKRELVKGVFYV